MGQKNGDLWAGFAAGSVGHILIMASDGLARPGNFLASEHDPAYVRLQASQFTWMEATVRWLKLSHRLDGAPLKACGS